MTNQLTCTKKMSSIAVGLIVSLVFLNQYNAINHWAITPDETIQPQVFNDLIAP